MGHKTESLPSHTIPTVFAILTICSLITTGCGSSQKDNPTPQPITSNPTYLQDPMAGNCRFIDEAHILPNENPLLVIAAMVLLRQMPPSTNQPYYSSDPVQLSPEDIQSAIDKLSFGTRRTFIDATLFQPLARYVQQDKDGNPLPVGSQYYSPAFDARVTHESLQTLLNDPPDLSPKDIACMQFNRLGPISNQQFNPINSNKVANNNKRADQRRGR